MQNTMLDSTVSSDSQELFSDLFRGSDLDDRPPNVVRTKKEAMDSTSNRLKWSFRMGLNDVSSTALNKGSKP